MPITLSRDEARRIAVRAQLLTRDRPGDLHAVVRELTLLQLDPTNHVAPSADLVLWGRLGSAYERSSLVEALADRSLLDLKGMARPAEDLPLYLAEMHRPLPYGRDDWVRANETCRRDILTILADEGPKTSRELPDTCDVPWQSSGWNNNRNVIRLLDMLAARGEIAVSGHRGADRLFDLAERVYPACEEIPYEQALAVRDERLLASLGIAQGVGTAGEAATVEGVRGKWRVDPDQLDVPFDGRTVLLSPLDRLIFDRKRMESVFAFDYQLEMYKPVAKRRWGYWALPILHGDRLVGKVDAAADQRSSVLRVAAVHEDFPFPASLTAAVRAELRDLADWLEMDLALPA